MARRACIKNIRSLTDVGDLEYEFVRPVLMRIENPEQLREIEKSSPQIIGQDEELWMEFIKRDVQDWKKKPHRPKRPENWHKVYKKLVKENQNQIWEDAKQLKRTMDNIQKERSKHRIERVELKNVALTEGMTSHGPTIRIPSGVKFTDRGTLHDKPPSKREILIGLGKLDPDAPRRAKPNNSLFEKLRRETREIPRFPQQPKKPTGIITAKEMALKPKPTNTKVTKAPQSMIDQYRRDSIPKPIDPTTTKAPGMLNPKKRKFEHEDVSLPSVETTEERQKRLKMFPPATRTAKPATMIRVPRSRPSTPAASPPKSSPPSMELSQTPKNGFPSSSVTRPQVTPTTFPTPKTMSNDSSVPPHGLACSNTTSPNNGNGRPLLKRKAPVDIFMRPRKQRREP